MASAYGTIANDGVYIEPTFYTKIIDSDGNTVMTKNLGGFYSGIDLGIVKYHFEIGAGKNNFIWG